MMAKMGVTSRPRHKNLSCTSDATVNVKCTTIKTVKLCLTENNILHCFHFKFKLKIKKLKNSFSQTSHIIFNFYLSIIGIQSYIGFISFGDTI